MDNMVTRSGIGGDEPSAWAEICAGYRQNEDTAFQLGLRARWRALRDGTVAGTASIHDWHEMCADIAELLAVEDDFAGRGDGSVPPSSARARRDSSGTGYRCPGGLCSREVAFSVLRHAPRCELLGRDMVDPAGPR